jgi:hypothetical protein
LVNDRPIPWEQQCAQVIAVLVATTPLSGVGEHLERPTVLDDLKRLHRVELVERSLDSLRARDVPRFTPATSASSAS